MTDERWEEGTDLAGRADGAGTPGGQMNCGCGDKSQLQAEMECVNGGLSGGKHSLEEMSNARSSDNFLFSSRPVIVLLSVNAGVVTGAGAAGHSICYSLNSCGSFAVLNGGLYSLLIKFWGCLDVLPFMNEDKYKVLADMQLLDFCCQVCMEFGIVALGLMSMNILILVIPEFLDWLSQKLQDFDYPVCSSADLCAKIVLDLKIVLEFGPTNAGKSAKECVPSIFSLLDNQQMNGGVIVGGADCTVGKVAVGTVN